MSLSLPTTSPALLNARLRTLSDSLTSTQTTISQLRTLPPNDPSTTPSDLAAEIHEALKDLEDDVEFLRGDVDDLMGGGGDKEGSGVRKAAGWVGSKGVGVGLGSRVRSGSLRGSGGIGAGEREHEEKERVVLGLKRLEEDLRSARIEFRQAQLQAKRNAEEAHREEKRLLFARAGERVENRKNNSVGTGTSTPTRARGRKDKDLLTQDDLDLDAANDVTLAMQRLHRSMAQELSRSQFAQEMLDESTAALNSLTDSHTTLDTLLSSSRTLASSLLRSQKSDTWYLETAFYLLLATIAWLFFRRILYGPTWWLIYLPLKLTFKTLFAVGSAVGLVGGAAATNSVSVSPAQKPLATGSSYRRTSDLPSDPELYWKMAPSVNVGGGGKGAGWGGRPNPPPRAPEATPSKFPQTEKVEEIIEEAVKRDESGQWKGEVEGGEEGETNVDGISAEERERQKEIPRNEKKRMFEAPPGGEGSEVGDGAQRVRDEL